MDPDAIEARKNIDHLWNFYCKYADNNFCKEFSRDFYSRFWEMYLAYVLYERGFPIDCPKPGPDIVIKDGISRIWIEAVAPKCGNEQAKDKVIDIIEDKNNNEVAVAPFEEKQVILRFRQAIENKLEQYHKYRKQTKNRTPIIREQDYYVIAISGTNLPWSCPDKLIQPLIVKAVFPIGSLYLVINPENSAVIRKGFKLRRSIQKSCGSPVTTDIFLQEEYSPISGILYSRTYAICNYPNIPGSEFIFIHNPFAKNKIPYGYFSMGREYIAHIHNVAVDISFTDYDKISIDG